MFTFKHLQKMFREEMAKAEKKFPASFVLYGLSDWKFELNNRVTAVGLCHYGNKTIYLSKHYLDRDEKYIRNSLIHEIAHALCPGAKHGSQWQKVFVTLGGDGQRTAVDVTTRPESTVAWKVVHKDTGHVYAQYARRPRRDFSVCIANGDRSTLGKLVLVKA